MLDVLFQRNITLHVALHSFDVFPEICIFKSNITPNIFSAISCTKAAAACVLDLKPASHPLCVATFEKEPKGFC